MALTLVLVSFSCTGPILGSLLVGSITSQGGAIQLTIGMLGFGVALALPFTIFALFPNLLKTLPKSGSWMNTFKVILGFLELGFAFKFLSNADLVEHWGILKREVFIGIWFVVSVLLCLYLIGVFKFPHETKKIKTPRFNYILGFVFLGTALYLFPALLPSGSQKQDFLVDSVLHLFIPYTQNQMIALWVLIVLRILNQVIVMPNLKENLFF